MAPAAAIPRAKAYAPPRLGTAAAALALSAHDSRSVIEKSHGSQKPWLSIIGETD
jgi:hypothetical protein